MAGGDGERARVYSGRMRWLALAPLLVVLHHPHLKLAGDVIHGTGFHSREHVRVVVSERNGARFTRRVVASPAGLFQADFSGISGPCVRFSVTATGSLGSRVTVAGMKFPDCIVR